ncbi:hypothetical protein Trydic_g6364 [Trypoxylus dichotomus]
MKTLICACVGQTQYPEKIDVWAGILRDQVIGPLYFNGNLNGEAYLDVLENANNPLINDALENQLDGDGNILPDEDRLHFQQEGTLAYRVLPVWQWLDNVFPNK